MSVFQPLPIAAIAACPGLQGRRLFRGLSFSWKNGGGQLLLDQRGELRRQGLVVGNRSLGSLGSTRLTATQGVRARRVS